VMIATLSFSLILFSLDSALLRLASACGAARPLRASFEVMRSFSRLYFAAALIISVARVKILRMVSELCAPTNG
jgi:hypothetical protein